MSITWHFMLECSMSIGNQITGGFEPTTLTIVFVFALILAALLWLCVCLNCDIYLGLYIYLVYTNKRVMSRVSSPNIAHLLISFFSQTKSSDILNQVNSDM